MFEGRSDKGLGLEIKQGVVFKTDPNGNAAGQQGFVQNADLAQRVIHREILVFGQFGPSCRHRNRPPGNVEGIELNHRPSGTFVAAFDHKFVQLGLGLGSEPGGVVQLLKNVAFALRFRGQFFRQRTSEGLQNRENNATGLGMDCDPFNVIENSVGKGVAVAVDFVCAQGLHQELVLDAGLRQKRNGQTRGVVSVQDIQTEILLRQLEGIQAVHILHHQVPNGHAHIQDRTFQKLQNQRFRRIYSVVGKLPHLVHAAVGRILISNRQYLVLVQRRIQGDIPQLGMKTVFGRCQLPGIGQFGELQIGLDALAR